MESKVISTAISKNMENLRNVLTASLNPKIMENKSEIICENYNEFVKQIKDNDALNNKDVMCNINNVNNIELLKEINKFNNTTLNENDNVSSDIINDENKSRTEIQDFFHGKNVFITGATGFLGKVLIEKLLRSCPGIENLYLMVRQKKGVDIYTRIDEIFEDPVFNKLKEEVPKFRHKVVVIPGDCGSVGLGLTLTDRQILVEKVNIIFHAAATVKFDEHIRVALTTNVRAPLHLLRLARDVQRLDVLMHISTAYSNSHLTRIEEVFYPSPVDCDRLCTLVDMLNDEQIERLLPTLLGAWPNTYTFTKALAENELKKHFGNLPLGIFRPAIVTSTAKEPLRCWIDNMYGPTGVVLGVATGVLRTVECNKDINAEIVPVDLVVNSLIAAARSVHKEYNTSSLPSEPPIFNYVSSVENRITWRKFMSLNFMFLEEYPLSAAMWYRSLILCKSATMNRVYMVFLHLLPAALIDGLAICIGQKPKLLKLYRKIHKFSSVLSYFCTHEIDFCNKRTRQLWLDTSTADREIFPFSISRLSWEKYFSQYIRGLRTYIFKENESTLEMAKRKWRRLYYLDQAVRLLITAFTIYLIWITLFKIFDLFF